MTTHALNPPRWVNNQDPNEIELTCVCGRFRKTFRPESKPGEPLPLDTAKAEFRERTRD